LLSILQTLFLLGYISGKNDNSIFLNINIHVPINDNDMYVLTELSESHSPIMQNIPIVVDIIIDKNIEKYPDIFKIKPNVFMLLDFKMFTINSDTYVEYQ